MESYSLARMCTVRSHGHSELPWGAADETHALAGMCEARSHGHSELPWGGTVESQALARMYRAPSHEDSESYLAWGRGAVICARTRSPHLRMCCKGLLAS